VTVDAGSIPLTRRGILTSVGQTPCDRWNAKHTRSYGQFVKNGPPRDARIIFPAPIDYAEPGLPDGFPAGCRKPLNEISSPTMSRAVVVMRRRVGSLVRVSRGGWSRNVRGAAAPLQSAIATHSVTEWCRLATAPSAGERQHAGRLHAISAFGLRMPSSAWLSLRLKTLAQAYHDTGAGACNDSESY